MILYLINLILALIWVIVTGSFTFLNLVFGFLLGAAALFLIRFQVGDRKHFLRAWLVAKLALFFLVELMRSAWKVATLVLYPNMNLKPGIFAYKLRAETDFEITLLANMITLTPGTLSVDVSDDRSTLYVHALDCSDPSANRADIHNGFEKMILEAFR
ncbi:Na+/H+ antiporter subunit E [Fulvimarina endophytica]|uniref:Na+/H+ antiporter subunit E n=1 Tax=Fulvimarina endophytica TaxID=2293836 RepID=A0A371X0A3_9HYPH|nr:Na+/H+ antiporter subunit E [Fulvimarina endophytica]RFC62668.1 Na+/H+ antiporter subunit E [Fulvimarina endophytica]